MKTLFTKWEHLSGETVTSVSRLGMTVALHVGNRAALVFSTEEGGSPHDCIKSESELTNQEKHELGLL